MDRVLAKPEIGQFDVSVPVNEDVIRLEVPVDIIQLVHRVNGQNLQNFPFLIKLIN